MSESTTPPLIPGVRCGPEGQLIHATDSGVGAMTLETTSGTEAATDRLGNRLAHRFLVVADRRGRVPAALLASLAPRGEVRTVLNLPGAMLDLALTSATRRTRAVVLTMPLVEPRAAEFAAAVQRFYPGTAVWTCDLTGLTPRLEVTAPAIVANRPPALTYQPHASSPPELGDQDRMTLQVDLPLSNGATSFESEPSPAPANPATAARAEPTVQGSHSDWRSLVVRVPDAQLQATADRPSESHAADRNGSHHVDDSPLAHHLPGLPEDDRMVSAEELAMLLGPMTELPEHAASTPEAFPHAPYESPDDPTDPRS